MVAIGGEVKSMAQALSERLRCQEMPVVGRISGNVLLLDPRSVLPEEDEEVLQALQDATAVLNPNQ